MALIVNFIGFLNAGGSELNLARPGADLLGRFPQLFGSLAKLLTALDFVGMPHGIILKYRCMDVSSANKRRHVSGSCTLLLAAQLSIQAN